MKVRKKLNSFSSTAQEVQFFRMEDVWVSGYIAQYLDIELQVSKHLL